MFNPEGATVFKSFLQYHSLLVGFEPCVLSISSILQSFKKQLSLSAAKCSKTSGGACSSPLRAFLSFSL